MENIWTCQNCRNVKCTMNGKARFTTSCSEKILFLTNKISISPIKVKKSKNLLIF